MSTRDWRAAYLLDLKGPYRVGCPRVPRQKSTREQRRAAIAQAAAALDVRQFLQEKRESAA